MKRFLTILSIMILILILGACGSNNDSEPADNNEKSSENSDEKDFENKTVDDSGQETHSIEKSDVESDDNKSQKNEITVTLNDVDGNEAAKATLTSVDDGVKVKLVGDGLPKEKAKHGFHVHEKGVCEPRDFKSAGGHYNPTDKNHGKEDTDGPHAGDFDNIEVDANGEVVDTEFTTDQISLEEDAENTVFTEDGTALVIHAGLDDYKTQPSGDAGDRIACGVIAEAK